MIKEKEITLCGKNVKMRYCAAAETGYEQLAGKAVDVFLPIVEKDDKGIVTKTDPPAATRDDYIKLAYAAIIAAYSRIGQEQPVSVNEIMFDAAPNEIIEMINAVVELRLNWYQIPEVLEEDKKTPDSPNV